MGLYGWLIVGAILVLIPVVVPVLFLAYVLYHYAEVIYRIFETKPLFLALHRGALPDTEPVTLTTPSGRKLAANYIPHHGPTRKGVILFCHEFSASRWLCSSYAGYLRDDGYDLFTFDFCNHGESESIANYEPLQWVTNHEVEDVETAVAYLKSRADADPAGIALFGVSKGGGAALVAASRDKTIRAVITDGAFPTHGTVTQYETKWVAIYAKLGPLHEYLPRLFYAAMTEFAIWQMQRKRQVKYLRIERAVRRLWGRPLLMIHGQRDNYINAAIVERLFREGGPHPDKSLWMVEGAKHNGCLDKAGEQYRERLRAFLDRYLAATDTSAAVAPSTSSSRASNSGHSRPAATSPGIASG